MANVKLLEDVSEFLEGRSAASLDVGAEMNLPLRVGDELHRLRNPAIPSRLLFSLQRYIGERVVTGGFLRSVLENDLAGAVLRADPESLEVLPLIVRWVHDEAPATCWGSVEAVAKWLGAENSEARRAFLRAVGDGQ